jgi:hypothetical protein
MFLALTLPPACAPSASEIRRVQETRYTCEFERVFEAVVEVVRTEEPPLSIVDPERGLVVSDFRWHEPSGMPKRSGAVAVGEGDRGFYVAVALEKGEGGYTVRAVPHVFEQNPESPRGREMNRDDANWPGWADGKAEDILVAVHQRLQGCASPPAE